MQPRLNVDKIVRQMRENGNRYIRYINLKEIPNSRKCLCRATDRAKHIVTVTVTVVATSHLG